MAALHEESASISSGEDNLSLSLGLSADRMRTLSGGTILRNTLSRICGTLRLDRTEIALGERVGVYWDIPGVVPHEMDWIGMFDAGERHGIGNTTHCVAAAAK